MVGITTPGSGIEIREAHKYRIENKQTNKIETDKKKKDKNDNDNDDDDKSR